MISKKEKAEILKRILKSKLNPDTLNFLMVLVNRDRINLVVSVVGSYLDIVYDTASIKVVEVTTAYPFNRSQRNTLIRKLKQITKAREIRLTVNVDPTLIGGFSIKTRSKILDFTVKNQLQNLAKHLDTLLDI
jgi:F-type H+-transporting ATPase subunit delta